MSAKPQAKHLEEALVGTWRTGHRITAFLVERLPEELWLARVPGAPRRRVRMIAGHLHNTRCMWVKTLGRRFAVPVPASVSRHRVTREELLAALEESCGAVETLLLEGLRRGGKLPGFPPDVTHLMTYLVAHEAHHRGQIVLIARQLGIPLPDEAVWGLWQWSKRSKEASDRRSRSSPD